MHRRGKHFWILLGLLAAWKLVRTDWVVTAPYWFGDPGKTSTPGGDHTTYDIFPPVRPIWGPPVPSDVEAGAKSWDSLYPGGGAWGITGPPVLRPNYLRMGIEVAGAFMILFPVSFLLRRAIAPLLVDHPP
jgi:hypothetical protein